jgi:FtsP/CotA-like multicopper oxidase with cupredoxin domain
MMTRTTWQTGLAAVALVAIGSLTLLSSVLAAPVPGGTLDPTTVPKYVAPLVIPPVMPAGTGALAPAANHDIAVRQFKQQILPGGLWNHVTGRTDPYGPTTVWSYGRWEDPLPDVSATFPDIPAGVAPAPNSTFNYPAFTMENTSNVATTVRWINDLIDPATGNYRPHLFAVDQTLHWANPTGAGCMPATATGTDCMTMNPAPYTGPVPLVTHVHGSHVNPDSDGYPEAWWLPGANNIPPGYVAKGSNYTQANNANAVPGSAYYGYSNTQPATTLWYHDHALGMTRLNVYAGPAGFWLIRGGANDTAAGVLPGPAPVAGDTLLELNAPSLVAGTINKRATIREIPLAIQDRSFDWADAAGNTLPNATGATQAKLFYPNNRAIFEGLNVPGQPPQIPGAGVLNIPFIDPTMMSDISPIWNPEAFFNTMVVNGSTWPELNVAAERYRLRLLNGCNSRTLNLSMKVVVNAGLDGINGTADDTLGAEVPFFQIGSEQGFLPQVVMIRTGFATPLPGNGNLPPLVTETALPSQWQALLMGPAERADVIVDFSGMANGTRVRILNTAPDAPFGGFPLVLTPADVADPGTTGQVMEFVVDTTIPAGAPSTPPQNLLLPAEGTLGAASNTRQLSLNEMVSNQVCVEANPITGAFVNFLFNTFPNDPNFATNCGPAALPVGSVNVAVPMAPRQAQLGIVTGGMAVPTKWVDPITEFPLLNSTEVWEIFNTTMDAHPVHLHLVRFKVVDRQNLNMMTLAPIAGTVTPPLPNEAGYKDTVVAYPGQVTRIKAKFDIAGLYVWHCHIVEHEDNEMMRPFMVVAAAPATGATLAPAITTPSPQRAGTAITFNAAATGGDPTGPYQYRFYWRPAASTTWTAGSAYTTSASWTWDTTALGLTPGTYYILVQTRHVGNMAVSEGKKSITFKLTTGTPATGATLLPAIATPSPQPAGTAITFTAAPTGGDPTGPYEYRFFWRPAASTTWTAGSAYTASASWTWDTTALGLAPGTYYILAQTRHVGNPALSEGKKSITFKLTTATPATGATLLPAIATPSPQPAGTAITFTAAATGGDPTGPYEYRFYWRPAASATWTAGSTYTASASWLWDTTALGLTPGTYYILVQTRHVGSTVVAEGKKSMGFTLN